ncbi:MAG TPA: glycoside hydrolase family 2 TIM barrel-domain containing protein, partial [Chloroflexota bacterium]|nr:glycoside hydrolase family 2 TIM barrel-domain containing protein [Chloroflexota bacterium]
MSDVDLQPLTGPWRIALDPEQKGRTDRWFMGDPGMDVRQAPVPGSIQQIFPSQYGVAWYWHSFTPAGPLAAGRRALLRFHAVDYLGEVWLNGSYLGSHEGSETPFILDATEAMRPGDNLLAVRVLNPTNTPIDGITLGQTPHRNKMLIEDFRPGNGLNYGGIVQPVDLLLVPAVRIVDLFARAESQSGQIDVTIAVQNDSAAPARVVLRVDAGPAQEGPVLATATVTADILPGETHYEATLQLPNHRLWSLDDPYLYRVAVTADATGADGMAYQHEQAVRCGFRDFRVVDGYFRLNGKRLYVRSTHTGNHFPIGCVVPDDHDLVRRDLIYARAVGFNMVRFISGMALPEQLDFCDEIGLLVYEENLAAWKLGDSPQLAERFDRSLREMILRDRNHPSVVIWGLLNETPDNTTFRHATGTLPLLRALDPTRTVLLSSGRWDRDATIGTVSNPGGTDWEYVWGNEGPEAPRTVGTGRMPADGGHPAYVTGAGDVHVYPQVPQTDESNAFLRTVGAGTKPVYLSEYGIGSLLDVDHIMKRYQQARTSPAADDLHIFQWMLDQLEADWARYGLAAVYPFPRDLLRESQRLHSRWRLFGLNLVRANPQIAGYNVTGMLDHGYTGEGVWTFWREWKPGVVEALEDGFAPLRWCLFVTPMHAYAGRGVTVEAVLANEDVLAPGAYPARLRIFGPAGPVWEQELAAQLPRPAEGSDAPLAVPVFKGEARLDGPAGAYVLAAQLERGGSPAGDRLTFHLSDPAALPEVHADVVLWGVDDRVAAWLAARGLRCRRLTEAAPSAREVLLVGDLAQSQSTADDWRALAARIAQGSIAVFLSPLAFRRGDDPLGWLPLAAKGRCHEFSNWVYHREDIAMPHPIFAGMPARGIMDWDYYGPVIPRYVFEGQETPDDIAALFISIGYASTTEVVKSGYASGFLAASYPFGAGRFLLNTLRILENVDRHPAADRLLLNMITYATGLTEGTPAS